MFSLPSLTSFVVGLLGMVIMQVPLAYSNQPSGSSHADPVTCDQFLGQGPLIWRLPQLEAAKAAVQAEDPLIIPAYWALMSDAAAAYLRRPYTVTDKGRAPPSGDLQDYTSLGPYWWPNPKTADGLPYVRKDGQINPEREGPNFDRRRSGEMIEDVVALTLAAFFSGRSEYAAKANGLLDTWFVNPTTRMNPNLNFGQSIPGRTEGRGIGIIDTAGYVDVVDAARLLEKMGQLQPQIKVGLKSWFAEYTRWLLTSPLGQDERAAKNNHGTFYDVQVAAFAFMAGDCDVPRRIFEDTKVRISKQIVAGGRMPLEETRTRSLHYYTFNTRAFLRVARLAEHVGVDLYNYEDGDGEGIGDTLLFLATYAGRESEWPYQTLGQRADKALWQVLQHASLAFVSPRIRDAAARSVGFEPTDRAVLLTWHTD